MNCTFRNGILGSLVIATMSLTSVAGTVTWTGGGDGVNWSDGGNWGGTAPSAGDMLVITFPATPLNRPARVGKRTLSQNVPL